MRTRPPDLPFFCNQCDYQANYHVKFCPNCGVLIMSSTQQSTAVANALSGEKSFLSVEYAVTGDELSSAISGITAVLKNHSLSPKCTALMLSMLSDVYEEYHKAGERQVESLQNIQQAIPSPWNTYPPYQNIPQVQRDTIAMQELLKKYSKSNPTGVVSPCP